MGFLTINLEAEFFFLGLITPASKLSYFMLMILVIMKSCGTSLKCFSPPPLTKKELLLMFTEGIGFLDVCMCVLGGGQGSNALYWGEVFKLGLGEMDVVMFF